MQTIYDKINRHCITDGKYGFTIPYIYKIDKDCGGNKELKDILFSFIDGPIKHIVTFCSDLDEYIIGLHKSEYAPLDMYENFGNLYYDDGKLGVFQLPEDFLNFLCDKYQEFIEAGLYSKNMDTQEWE